MATFAGALGRGLAGYAQNRERADQRDAELAQQQRAEARQAQMDGERRVQMADAAAEMKRIRERQQMQDQRDSFEGGYRGARETGAVGDTLAGAADVSSGTPFGALMGGLGTYGRAAQDAAKGPAAFTMQGQPMVKAVESLAERTARMSVEQRRGERMAGEEFTMKRDATQAGVQATRDTRQNAFQAGENAKSRAATLSAATMRSNQPPKAKLPTEGERKAAALYSVAEQGYNTLEGLLAKKDEQGKTVVDVKGQAVMRGAPTLGERMKQRLGMGVGNVVTSDQQRQVTQAGLQLSDMWLRYTSGAAVPEQEVERFAQTFTPVPGDDPTVLKQKQAARARILSALKGAAGRALTVPPEDGTEPDLNDAGFREFIKLRREDEP